MAFYLFYYVRHCNPPPPGGMRRARIFGSRTRTFCSVPEYFVPCTNKMFFFVHFTEKKFFIFFLRTLNYLLSALNLFISVYFFKGFNMIPKYFRLGRYKYPLFAETEVKVVLLLKNVVVKLAFILISIFGSKLLNI